MNKLLTLMAAALLAGCATTPKPSPLAAEFDAAIGQAIANLPAVPGLSVAMYSRDGIYARGFGVTDVNTREPANADTAFYIASSTKPLTGLALAILEARGELELDATLSAYAPDANFPASIHPDQVTLRQLLSHTSGIANNPIAYRLAFSGEHDPQLLWSLLASSKVNEQAPLGKFRYTNTGYNIATLLTDRKLGKSWQDLLDREIFTPAGMTHSAATMTRAAGWPLAKPHGYSLQTHRTERISLEKSDRTMQSAGGVVMSARDATRWLELLVEDGRVDGRQVIPAAALRATRQPLATVNEKRDDFTRDSYGLGWYIGKYLSRSGEDAMLHAFGNFSGARAHVSWLPDRHVGVAVFINDSTVSASVVDLVAKYLYDRLAGRVDARATFDAAVATLASEGPARFEAAYNSRAARPWTLTRPRGDYVGTYVSAAMGTLRITAEGDSLRASIGVLSAVATPFTEPESMRVELAPFQGDVIRFQGEKSELPAGLLFGGERFDRIDLEAVSLPSP